MVSKRNSRKRGGGGYGSKHSYKLHGGKRSLRKRGGSILKKEQFQNGGFIRDRSVQKFLKFRGSISKN